MYLSQSLGRSSTILLSINSSVPLNFSTSKLHIGWYRVDRSCLNDKSLPTSFMTSEINWGPLSLKISFGIPTLANMSTSTSETFSVSVLLSATASRNR